jgi:hypothetical protein
LLLATGGNSHVAQAGLIDMAVGAYVVAGLMVLVNAWPSLRIGQGRAADVLLLGLFAGGCAACKYPGWLLLVVPLVLALGFAAIGHRSVRQLVIQGLILGVGLTVTGLPWLLKNTVETGNPIYPLAYHTLGGSGMSAEGAANWQRVHSPQTVDGRPPFSLAALWDSVQQLIVASPFLNPSLVFLSIVGLGIGLRWRLQSSWLPAACLLLAWMLAIWWFATHRIDRFWLPILPLTAMIAAVALSQIGQYLSSGLANLIVLTGLCFGLLQILSGAGPNDNRFMVSLASIESESLGPDASGAITPTAWINSSMDERQRILLIGEAEAYHYRVPLEYATCFNAVPGQSMLVGHPPATQLEKLKQAGITHLLVHWAEIERYRSPGNYGFSPWPTRRAIEQLISDGVVRREDSPFDPQVVEILSVVTD